LVATHEAAILCSNLAKGLHAAAQPLAILRASLDVEEIESMSRGELQELATSSAIHIERVCILYSCIEQLVTTESITPELTSMLIEPVLAEAIDGVNLLFDHQGINLVFQTFGSCEPVLINRARTVQAVSSALLIARVVSRAADTVEMIASPSFPGGVRVVIRNSGSPVDSLDAEARLRMDIAESNIRSQGGSFFWRLQPFDVQIELRKAPLHHSS
jgi:hypothetical protein